MGLLQSQNQIDFQVENMAKTKYFMCTFFDMKNRNYNYVWNFLLCLFKCCFNLKDIPHILHFSSWQFWRLRCFTTSFLLLKILLQSGHLKFTFLFSKVFSTNSNLLLKRLCLSLSCLSKLSFLLVIKSQCLQPNSLALSLWYNSIWYFNLPTYLKQIWHLCDGFEDPSSLGYSWPSTVQCLLRWVLFTY